MVAYWNEDVDLLWLPTVCGAVLVIILEIILRPRLTSMSVDMMEHANLSELKESAKNCWTNMGVTAALLLTVDVAMLQSDGFEPRFQMEDVDESDMARLQLLYDFLSYVALMYCIWSLLQCVVCLCYLDPMDNTGAIKFFVANPASIGGPALSIIMACLHTCIALVVWVLGTSGLVNCIVAGVFTLVIAIFMIGEIVDKATFDPSGETAKSMEWQWPLKPQSEWPWFVQKHKKNPKAIAVFTRMGKAIAEAEGQPTTSGEAKATA